MAVVAKQLREVHEQNDERDENTYDSIVATQKESLCKAALKSALKAQQGKNEQYSLTNFKDRPLMLMLRKN
eukprot:scaffold244_cov172-Amphora_coffeaeformis.AAC.33